MQSLQDHEDETTTTTTTTTKTTTTSKTKAKDKAAGSPKGNDYYDDDYYYDDYYYDDYYYDFDFSKMPPSFRPMRRTNGASKHLGFSFLLDPLLNDVYNNPQGDSLSNNFFEGFQVGLFSLSFSYIFPVPQVLVHSPYEFAEVIKLFVKGIVHNFFIFGQNSYFG